MLPFLVRKEDGQHFDGLGMNGFVARTDDRSPDIDLVQAPRHHAAMWETIPSPAALALAHTIQLVVAPVFLLSGIGALLNVFALRLNRVVDRARHIETRFNELDGAEHDRAVWELRIIDRRMSLISASITLCTVSAVAVSLVVAGLFIARLAGGGFGRTVAVLFVAAMAALVVALGLFLIEIRLANRSLRIRHELLEKGKKIEF